MAESDSPSKPELAIEQRVEPKLPHYVGEVLGGRYRIVRRVGAGGMGDVYEVEHVRLGSRFAAKIPRATVEEEGVLRRFQREARLLANLKSDHIVTVFDVSEPDEDPPYMIMELLNGQDLRQLLGIHGMLGVERAVKLVLDACAGLAIVHAAGLVHRDLKPENLFVVHRDSGEELCKLLDFGVIKAAHGTSTQHGSLIGTLKYMAPEQIEPSGRVTPQSDVRSLGAILYECLVGKPPFEADSTERLMYQVLNGNPRAVEALRPELPADLAAAVMRSLEREPQRRFASVRAFADALRPFVGTAGADFSQSATIRGDTGPVSTPAVRRSQFDRRLGAGAGVLFVSACLWAWAARDGTKGESPAPKAGEQDSPRAVEGSALEPARKPVSRSDVAPSAPTGIAAVAEGARPLAPEAPSAAARPSAVAVAPPAGAAAARERPRRAVAASAPREAAPVPAVSNAPARLRIEAKDPYAQ